MTSDTPLYGLVLAGGASKRMQRDKAALVYDGKPQLLGAFDLLQSVCLRTFVSVRRNQTKEALRAGLPQIVDRLDEAGPIAGIHAAQAQYPDVAWLVVACDLPFLQATPLQHLLLHRDRNRLATAYVSSHDGLPEPLCAVYEPQSRSAIWSYIETGGRCPREFLLASDIRLLQPLDPRALDNINTPAEYAAATGSVAQSPGTKEIHVRYFAILREQAGHGEEKIVTTAVTPADLYEELKARHTFSLQREQLKVAVNAEFGEWTTLLHDRDAVVFIPPMAGG